MKSAYLNQLGDLFHDTAKNSGFHPPTQTEIEFLKEFVANEHGEVSELWEALRKAKCNRRQMVYRIEFKRVTT